MDAILDMMWDDERGVAYLVDQRVRRFREEHRGDYASPEELEAVIAENIPDWCGYAQQQWREELDRPLCERRMAPPGKRAATPDEFLHERGYRPRLAPVLEYAEDCGSRLVDEAAAEPIDIYERNVLVVGGREGVAAARRIAARSGAAGAANSGSQGPDRPAGNKSSIRKTEVQLGQTAIAGHGGRAGQAANNAGGAGRSGGMAGDERYRHDMATWVKATKWLEAILVEK